MDAPGLQHGAEHQSQVGLQTDALWAWAGPPAAEVRGLLGVGHAAQKKQRPDSRGQRPPERGPGGPRPGPAENLTTELRPPSPA